jgi:hypothetical protein
MRGSMNVKLSRVEILVFKMLRNVLFLKNDLNFIFKTITKLQYVYDTVMCVHRVELITFVKFFYCLKY